MITCTLKKQAYTNAMSLRPRPPVAPGDSSRGRLQTVLLAGQSASTGSKFPLTYNQLRAKVPVHGLGVWSGLVIGD